MNKPRLVKIDGRWEVQRAQYGRNAGHSGEIAHFWAFVHNVALQDGETRMQVLEQILQANSIVREWPQMRKFYMQQCALKGQPPRRDLYPVTPVEFMQVVRAEWPGERPILGMRDALMAACRASERAAANAGRDHSPPINGEFASPYVKRTWAYLKWIEIAGAARLQELKDYLARKPKP